MSENIETKTVDTNVIMPFKKKLAYGLGDFGNNFSWTFVGSFLTFFYTDVFGLSAGAVATLILVSRIWDAINDPIVGALADRTKTRWGRYRVWELVAAPICAVLVIVTYTAHPEWSTSSKTIYMYVSYGLLVLAYTCVNLPYGTMASAMTQNIAERGKLSTFRLTSALIAIQCINAVTNPLALKLGNGDKAVGYHKVAIVYAIIFVIMHMICGLNSKEVLFAEKKTSVGFFQNFKAVAKNKYFIIAVICQTIWGFNVYGRGALGMYYFTYYEGDVSLFSTFSLFGMGSFLGASTFSYFYGKLKNKGRVAALAAFGAGIFMAPLGFLHCTSSPAIFYACTLVSSLFSGLFTTSVYAVVPDTAEYGEWKTGVRNDGFQYAFVSFGNKVGQAIGSAGGIAILGALGYVANQTQSETVLNALNFMWGILPPILWIVSGLLFLFYKIDQDMFNSMLAEIKARKN